MKAVKAGMNVTCLTDETDTFTGHVYLVTGERTTLVDAGAMSGIVEQINCHVSTVDSLLITHRHDDHIAKLEEVRNAFDPTVYAADPKAGERQLEDGDSVVIGDETFEVVETPGHAPDHITLMDESTLFSGDVVVYSDGAFDDGSFGRTDIPGADRETLIASLDRLLDRLPSTVSSLYPGHGPAFHGDVNTVIERARDRAGLKEPKYPAE